MNYFPKFTFFLLASSTACSSSSAHQVLKDETMNAKVEEMANLDLSVELVAQFHAWVDEHEKVYETQEEKMERLKVWIANDGTYNSRILFFYCAKYQLFEGHGVLMSDVVDGGGRV